MHVNSTGGPWKLDQRRGDDTDGDVDDHLVGMIVPETVNAGTIEVVFTSDGFYFTGTGTTLNAEVVVTFYL